MENFDITKLRWTKGDTATINDVVLKSATANHTFTGLQPAIGVDPGRRFGIGMVMPYPNDVMGGYLLTTYWGVIPQEEKAPNYFHRIRDFVKAWMPKKCDAKIVMIEGSSFGEQFGREMLEGCRLGFWEAFRELGYPVEYIAPLKARKQIFGNGRIKGKEVWLELDGNASDSGVLALYGGGYQFDKA